MTKAPTKASSTKSEQYFGERLKEDAETLLLRTLDEKYTDIYARLFDVDQFQKLAAYDDRHKVASKWYPYMPLFGEPNFGAFLASSRELALYVYNDEEIVLEIIPHATAAADQTNKKIMLPANVFERPAFLVDKEFPPVANAPLSEMITSTVNGLILHEAAHFAKSLATVKEMFDKLSRPEAAWLNRNKRLAVVVFNVAEDIYIEDWLRQMFPSYKSFLQSLHNYYFHDAEFVSRLARAYESAQVSSASRKNVFDGMFDGPLFMDFLILCKNWRFHNLDLWGPLAREYVELFLAFKERTSAKARARSAYEMTKKLSEDKRLIWPPEPDGEDGEVVAGSFDLGGQSVTIIIKKTMELEAESDSALASKDVRDIKKEFEEQRITILVETNRHEVGQVRPVHVQKPHSGDAELIEPDKRFRGLGRLLRRTLTHNYAPGEPMKRGQVLVNTRLYRIATDQKIFSFRERRKATGRDYEIGILVDCSGSMSGDKVVEAMSVGVAAWLSLKSASIRTALMGHTTVSPCGAEQPVLYLIGMPKDATRVVLSHAAAFLSRRVRGEESLLRNNIDGHSLLEASKYFSDKPTRKWLFHICDGQPAGHNYHGGAAMAHTALAAKQIRKRGIDVVCITIDMGVWEANDRIYGEEKNVKTTSPYVLKELIEAMFKKGKTNGTKGYS